MSSTRDTVTFLTNSAEIDQHSSWRSLFRAKGITNWVTDFTVEKYPNGIIKVFCVLSRNR